MTNFSSPEIGWIALSLVERIGKKTLLALLDQFNDDPLAVLGADAKALRQVEGVGPKIAAVIQAQAAQVHSLVLNLERWARLGVRAITLHDPAYPPQLAALEDAPPTVFVLGDAPLPTKAAAIVGTRKPSSAALGAARRLAAELAARDVAIVSGLALGVDTLAHMGALDVPDGRTFAVLGCGVLNVYPPENHLLSQHIVGREAGALLCEVHPEAGVNSPALVARNRIISGLCEKVFVIETDIDGGAMHAARFAKAQGRAVYTLDLPASGNRALIADGAGVVDAKLDMFRVEP